MSCRESCCNIVSALVLSFVFGVGIGANLIEFRVGRISINFTNQSTEEISKHIVIDDFHSLFGTILNLPMQEALEKI
jgi:hypothetical protein